MSPKGKVYEDLMCCIACKTPLYIDRLDTELGTYVEVLFCPEGTCPRYGLYTKEPESEEN